MQADAVAHVALGFRAHSGWAAVVAVAGPLHSPVIVDRQRIAIADPNTPGSVQPYHAAQKLTLKEADQFVRRCTEASALLARQALRQIMEDARRRGQKIVGCGILRASGRPLTTLSATLASHALIHTAEGELFRDALATASSHYDLAVTGIKERELIARAKAELSISTDKLQRHIVELGRNIGPPWRQDQKYAALVAWLVLASAGTSKMKEATAKHSPHHLSN
jgi:hypothetical protein